MSAYSPALEAAALDAVAAAFPAPPAWVQSTFASVAAPPAIGWPRLGACRLGRVDWVVTVAAAAHDAALAGRRRAYGCRAARLGGDAPLTALAILRRDPARRRPGHLVLGFAGPFWRPWAPLAAPSWAEFCGWRQPRTARVAWVFTLAGAAAGGTRLALTVAGDAACPVAKRAFLAYLTAVGPLSRWLRGRLLAAVAGALAAARAPPIS